MSDPFDVSRELSDKSAPQAPDVPRAFRKKVVLPPALDSIMKDVAPAPAQAQEYGAGPMARIERRLSMVERAFADISDRHENALRERASQMASVEEGVVALRRRLDDSEKHQGAMMSDLRDAVLQAGSRLNALEADAATLAAPDRAGFQNAGFQNDGSQSDWPERDWNGALGAVIPQQIEAAVAAAVPAISREEAALEADASAPETEKTRETYLSAARRAARDSLGAEIGRPRRVSKPRLGVNRAQLLIFGALAPLMIAGVAIVALNRHTVSAEAVSPVMSAASVRRPVPASEPVVSATAEERAVPATPARLRNLGLDYLSGHGVPLNESEAARLMLQAAYQGDSTAQYWLGTLYAQGRGVPADTYQADHWYETAARAGNPKAMHRFAVANLQGSGVDKSAVEAAHWFKNAAERGFTDSAFNLGVLYEEGSGVPRSGQDAYKWYAVAAMNGDAEAASRLPTVAKSLSPAEIALAQHAAENFHPLAPGTPVTVTP